MAEMAEMAVVLLSVETLSAVVKIIAFAEC